MNLGEAVALGAVPRLSGAPGGELVALLALDITDQLTHPKPAISHQFNDLIY
jgi:hypothetical protein